MNHLCSIVHVATKLLGCFMKNASEKDANVGKYWIGVKKMNRVELIKQAIESAKCRIYKLNFDLNGEISAHHQKKAENQKELQEITVEALEKQIPKVVINKDDFYDYCECPSCKSIATDGVGSLYKYCRECGQKLKLSEEGE